MNITAKPTPSPQPPAVRPPWGFRDQAATPHYDFLYTNKESPLPDDEAKRVVDELHDAMPGYNVRQYFASQPTIFKDYAHLTLARDRAKGTYAGLLGSRWFTRPDFTYLYLWTAMIAGDARRAGLVGGLFLYQLAKVVEEKGMPFVISTKTYNPGVLKAMQALQRTTEGVTVYPQIGAPRQDPEMVELAKRVTGQLCPTLTVNYEDAVVVGGQAVVGPDFFPEMPPSNDPAVDEHFKKHLTRKDQILVVVRFPEAGEAGFRGFLQMAAAFQFDVAAMMKAIRDTQRPDNA